MNPFVLDWLAGQTKATEFLPRTPHPTSGHPPPARRGEGLLSALTASNRSWDHDVAEEIRRWAEGGTFTIITGQQVGFAGGPLYTLVKLASLLKVKRDNEARGIPTTAFFWLATEDHDFNEVAKIALPRREGARGQLDLIWLRATRGVESRRIVGPEPVPEPLVRELLALLDIPRPRWLREGISFRDSFAELLATAAGATVIFVDALLPELRRAGKPLFDSITAHWDTLQRELRTRSAALQRAGYTPQVTPREGEPYTLLYELDEHGNRQLVDSPRPLPAPERVSTSALTRPLLQDFVLRPDLFIGGPAEVAYYAQIAPLHGALQVPMPRVALRAHALVAPPRVIRTLSKYGIDPAEVFSGADALLAEREPEAAAKVRAIAEEARRRLAEDLTRIGEIALPADHALARALSRSIGHIEYHFDKLTERAIRAIARKERERWTAVREVVETLYPDHHPQDRVVGWIAYWCQFGKDLVERLIDEVEPDVDMCKIVAVSS